MQEKVAVVPGDAFGECGEGFVRVCYSRSMDDIIEAVSRIKDLWKKTENRCKVKKVVLYYL